MAQAYAHTNSKGQMYYLHTKKVTLKGGLEMPIYYFSKTVKPEFALGSIPSGYHVIESTRTRLPLLKKD